MNKIHVLLVNEILLMCNIIASVLEDEEDMQVVGMVTSVEAALDIAENCDVVLISTNLPEHGAIKLTRALVEKYAQVKVLLLGLAESESEILQYVEAGASGYILKDDTVELMLEHIRAAYNNTAFISPEIAAALIAKVNELAKHFQNYEGASLSFELTHRERQVLQLLSQNLTNQEIAEQLVIEVGTVKNHVHSILEKLKVSSRQDAAVYWSILQNKIE
jgi:DNA-binding NarL/FixJ family response regulator